jgi:hypothetical protein
MSGRGARYRRTLDRLRELIDLIREGRRSIGELRRLESA